MLRKWITGFIVGLALIGCASTADYQGNVNAAQLTNTAILKMVGTAANAGLISQKDGYNLVKQIDTAQEGIDIANGLPAGEGMDKIAASRAILKEVRNYLILKGVK